MPSSSDVPLLSLCTQMSAQQQDENPWLETDPMRRMRRALETGYMADVTVTFESGEQIWCHTFPLIMASPKFAALVREHAEFHLPSLDPMHFRLLLEIIYTGEILQTRNVETMLKVGRIAHELQVHAAEVYCAEKLCSMVDVNSSCQVLDFAQLISDKNLEETCLKLIKENAGVILQTPEFISCERNVLETIVKQEELSHVDELQIFLACVRWATEHPNTDLDPVVRHIRFLAIPAVSFVEHVMLSGLLTAEEERDVLCCILKGVDDLMPEGLSRQKMRGAKLEIAVSPNKCFSEFLDSKLTTERPIRFITTKNGHMIFGVELSTSREDKKPGERYWECIEISLRNEAEVVLASGIFKEFEVKCGTMFLLKFVTPYVISANVVYTLHVNFSEPDVKRKCYVYDQSLKFDTEDYQLRDLAFSPIESIIFIATGVN